MSTNECWSDELRETTRRVLDEKDFVPMRAHVHLKNIDGRFGQVGVGDWLSGWPMSVTDRQSGAASECADCNALIADGWAVD